MTPARLTSVIRDLLREEIEVARIRAHFLRLKVSGFARDQFREGYIAGYQAGRKDEGAGLPDASDPGGAPEHPQVDAHGVQVDEGMRDLLVALWKLGLDTEYSCQGEPGKFAPNRWFSRDYASQIVFADLDQAHKFLKKTLELVGDVPVWDEGGISLRTMLPVDGGSPRAEVTFSPKLLPEVTRLWVEFQTTVPVAAEVD